jgi:hypothetical protein
MVGSEPEMKRFWVSTHYPMEERFQGLNDTETKGPGETSAQFALNLICLWFVFEADQ